MLISSGVSVVYTNKIVIKETNSKIQGVAFICLCVCRVYIKVKLYRLCASRGDTENCNLLENYAYILDNLPATKILKQSYKR